MQEKIIAFRDSIYNLRTRRLGKVAEYMIEFLLRNLRKADNINYDYHSSDENKIEVKFSVALKKNKPLIKTRIIDTIIEESSFVRVFYENEMPNNKFDSNIQQIKKKHFNILYYGIFFLDKVVIFRIDKSDINKGINYSDFQHDGNKGEGQFHINNNNYMIHKSNYFFKELTYKELYDLFSNNT